MASALVSALCVWWYCVAGASTIAAAKPSTLPNDEYRQGILLKDDGQWEEALETWWSARGKLDERGQSDPRIGIAFIELATEERAEADYGRASEIYLWGFSGEILAEAQAYVKNEVERIIPLLEPEEGKRWKNLAKNKALTLANEIRQFWLESDPRPKTQVNERLIEHWQRIDYSRKHFQKSSNSIYGTDDRGLIYVKYGEPFRTQSGRFGMSPESHLELLRFAASPGLRMRIQTEDPHPEYDIWLYVGLGPDETNMFLFSQKNGRGRYGLREGVESTIPRDSAESAIGGRSLRYIFQLLYYADLKLFSLESYDRYREIEEVWTFGSSRMRLQSIFFNNRKEDVDKRKDADVEKSNYERRFASLSMGTRNVRLLGDNNRPNLAVIAISVLQPRDGEEDAAQISVYGVEHTMIIRDENFAEIERMSTSLSGGADNGSVFQVEQLPNYAHISLSAEGHEALSDTLFAIGRISATVEPALNPDPTLLEVSDLVLGVEFRADEERRNHAPLPLLPTQEFFKVDPMQVYLEVYHIKRDEAGAGRISLKFAANRLDPERNKVVKKEEVSLTFDSVVAQSTSKEYYGFDLSKLREGLYELTASVRDVEAAQEKTRAIRFRVVE